MDILKSQAGMTCNLDLLHQSLIRDNALKHIQHEQSQYVKLFFIILR